MPTYVYRCDSCGHQFELFQRMSDDPVDTCPACANKVRRVIHPVGVVFKGSGWYVNDSRSKGSTDAPASTESKSEPAATAEPAKATESKPAPAKVAAD